MRLKKFENYEKLNENKYDEFVSKLNSYIDYDEDEIEQGDEPSNVDIFSYVGDLSNEFKFDTNDLQNIVDEYKDDFNVQLYVKGELEYELKNSNTSNKKTTVKDSWTREEVVSLIRRSYWEIEHNSPELFNKWIEQNL